MGRLIDADAEREGFMEMVYEQISDDPDNIRANLIIDYYDSLPTVDAVAVLRCRDCTHWGTGSPVETEIVKCCEYAGYMIGENGYCLYGERK